MTARLVRTLVLALSMALFTGCVGGVRVLRSDPTARVDPAPLAVAGLTLPAEPEHVDARGALRSFEAALDDALPGYTFVDAAEARYHLELVDLEVRRHDGDTEATFRLALSEPTGRVLDEVMITAIGHDPQHAGLEAARHFGRYLSQRDVALE